MQDRIITARRFQPAPRRSGFTLVELMVVITIIALLTGLTVVAAFAAQEQARAAKTESLIARLDSIIMPMYDEYQSRSPSINTIGLQGRFVAKARLDALRELQKLEMPDRWTDIGWVDSSNNPVSVAVVSSAVGLQKPAISNSYYRRFVAAVAQAKLKDPANYQELLKSNEQAETLYLIIALNGDGLELFQAGDIGDTDGDGAKEILDGWGRPIRWLRWPAGYDSPLNRVAAGAVNGTPSATSFQGSPGLSPAPNAYTGMLIRFVRTQSAIDRGKRAKITAYDPSTNPPTFTVAQAHASDTLYTPTAGDRFHILGPDQFDSHRIYPLSGGTQSQPTFEIHPLIFSEGRDGVNGIVVGESGTIPFSYAAGTNNNNPYIPMSDGYYIGQPKDDGGTFGHDDSITNHDLTRK